MARERRINVSNTRARCPNSPSFFSSVLESLLAGWLRRNMVPRASARAVSPGALCGFISALSRRSQVLLFSTPSPKVYVWVQKSKPLSPGISLVANIRYVLICCDNLNVSYSLNHTGVESNVILFFILRRVGGRRVLGEPTPERGHDGALESVIPSPCGDGVLTMSKQRSGGRCCCVSAIVSGILLQEDVEERNS